MRTKLAALVVVTCVTGLPVGADQSPQAPRQLEVAFDAQGRVTVAAQGVTVREILAEWSRKGGSQILNLEKLAGPVLAFPVRFENQPEIEVLQSLLASAAGLIVGPREVGTPGPSRLGTIVILASSTPTAAYAPPPAPRQVAPPPVTPGSPDDELPPVRPPNIVGQPGAPAATQPPPPQQPANRPGVFTPVTIVPITAVPPGRGGGTPPTTTGRGGGGGGVLR